MRLLVFLFTVFGISGIVKAQGVDFPANWHTQADQLLYKSSKVSTLISTDELMDDFAAVIWREIDERYSGGEESPLFDTCYDWHSSVHCHWALLRINLHTDRHAEWADAVSERMQPDLIAEELEKLQESPTFEFPYGRAWLLKLATEFEQWAVANEVEDADRFHEIGDYVAQQFIDVYSRVAPKADTNEYGNGSWALLRLIDYLRFRGDEVRLEQAESLYLESMLPLSDDITFATDLIGTSFFSRSGNWLKLWSDSGRVDFDAELSRRSVITDRLMPNPLRSYRVAGQNWSRVWAMKSILARTTDTDLQSVLETAIDQHISRGMELHTALRDAPIYTHWVSQFGVYALTESAE